MLHHIQKSSASHFVLNGQHHNSVDALLHIGSGWRVRTSGAWKHAWDATIGSIARFYLKGVANL
jgi:hypothetical protein